MIMDEIPENETQARLMEELETILACDLSSKDAGKPLHELGVDSMGLVELFVAIEKIFGIKLMESGLTKEAFLSVESLASAINKLNK